MEVPYFTYDTTLTELDPTTSSYYVKVSSTDYCNKPFETSEHRSIHLTGEKIQTGIDFTKIEWNNYEGWTSGIAGYELYTTPNDNPLNTTAEDEQLPFSTVTELTYTNELEYKVCYRIKGEELAGNEEG